MKLAHEQWSGQWQIVEVGRPGQRYDVLMTGRKLRRRTVSASNVKPCYDRQVHLRHAINDEFAQVRRQAS